VQVHIEPEIENYAPAAYKSIMSVLAESRCRIVLKRIRKKLKKKRKIYLKYPVLDEAAAKKMNILIVFSPYATSHKAREWSRKYKIPLLHLEKGFLPRSVLCDITGFWGDSFLHKQMPLVLDKMTNDENYQWALKYSNDLVYNNISKRNQPSDHTKISGNFVFLPMQYMNDQSVLKFGNMPYQKFVKKVASFCSDNKIILALKKHPHAYLKETKAVNKLLSKLKKRHGKYFKVVDGSIHWFCQKCLFMAGMNTGATIDGLINGCIISHCGQSIFENSGAVIHDNNVRSALNKCLTMSDEDKMTMAYRQKILVYYLYNRYLLLEDDTHKSEYSNEDKIRNQISTLIMK